MTTLKQKAIGTLTVALLWWMLPAAAIIVAVALVLAGVLVPWLTGLLGRRRESRFAQARGDLGVSVVDLARLYGQLGQREKTLALLEEGYRQHSPLLLDIQNDCSFDFLHNDERYRSLIKRIGLPPAW